MRRSTRPGDLPLPRPIPRGQAAVIYWLGRAAGERAVRQELAELAQEVTKDPGDFDSAEAELRRAPTDLDPLPSMPLIDKSASGWRTSGSCAPRGTRRRWSR